MDNKSRQFSGFDAIQPALNEMGQMARDSNDESKNPWAGVRYQSGVPTFHKVYRGVQGQTQDRVYRDAKEEEITKKLNQMRGLPEDSNQPWHPEDEKKSVGQHWTDSEDVATGFAQVGDHSYNPSETGRVYTGLVHDKDVWKHDEPGAAEHFKNYFIPNESDGEDPFDEKEKTVKFGSPIAVTDITDLSVKPDAPVHGGFKFQFDSKKTKLTPPEVYRA